MLTLCMYIDRLIDDASRPAMPWNMGKIARAHKAYKKLYESALAIGWVSDIEKWKPY